MTPGSRVHDIDAVQYVLATTTHQAHGFAVYTEHCKREERCRKERGGSQEWPRLSRYLGANGATDTKACRAGGAVGSICVRNCATSTASRKAHTGGESASSGVAVSTLGGGNVRDVSGFKGVGGGAASCAEGNARVVCRRGVCGGARERKEVHGGGP